MSATRCPGTGRASTGSSCAARRSCAGRSTATCSRRCARGAWRSGAGVLLEPGVWITAPGDARVRIGAGTFLNLGVMVAAQELVEIGEHCMLANGCFVSDATHRFDDPVAADHLAGLREQGADAHRRQLLARGQRRRHQRRDDRRALRDRRQQRRHARHRAVLDRRRRARARAAPGRAARITDSSRSWTCTRRCAALPPRRRFKRDPVPREVLRARARQRPLRPQRRQPPGLAGGRRAGPRARAARCATSTCPHWRAYMELTGGARDARRARGLRPGAVCGWCERADEYAEQLDEVPAAPRRRRAARRTSRSPTPSCRARASSAAPRSTRSCRTCCWGCAPRVSARR